MNYILYDDGYKYDELGRNEEREIEKELLFYEKFSTEWDLMTQHYEKINSRAKTISRMATAEETKQYMEQIQKDRAYYNKFHDSNYDFN